MYCNYLKMHFHNFVIDYANLRQKAAILIQYVNSVQSTPLHPPLNVEGPTLGTNYDHAWLEFNIESIILLRRTVNGAAIFPGATSIFGGARTPRGNG